MEPIIGLDFGNFNSFPCYIQDFNPGTRMGGIVHDLLPRKAVDGIPSVYFYSKRLGRALCGEEAVTGKAKPEQNRLRYLKELCPKYAEFDYEIALSEDFAKQKEGTVFIRAFSDNSEGQGSGVIISDLGYVLTCEHVIHDSDDIMVKLTNISAEPMIKWEPAVIVWFDEELDAAILKINPRENLALPIESKEYVSHSGESIYMVGFPFGGRLSDDLNLLSPSMFFGKVASVQKKKGLDRIDVNMEAKRGCSGGPVFSEKSGAVIGILCGSQTHGGDGVVEEVNYVLPIKYVWERIITNQNNSQQGE